MGKRTADPDTVSPLTSVIGRGRVGRAASGGCMVRLVAPDDPSELGVLSAESADFSAVWLAGCMEFAEFGGEPVGLVAQGQDLADSGEVEALGEEGGDVGDPVDVLSAVPASAAAGAKRA